MKLDYNYYRNMYFDLKDLSNKQLYFHFRKFGMWEGRICSRQFLRHKQNNNFAKLFQIQKSLNDIDQDVLDKEENLINIIIRTHNRPNFFKINFNSIKEQKYSNYVLYITYENEETLDYIKENVKEITNVKLIQVTKGPENVFYNLYCNTVLDIIEDGYNMFLDDDDMLTHPHALKYINSFLSEKRFLCWEYMRADKIIGPRKNQVKCGEIVSCGFCYNNKHKAKWTPTVDGDHVFAKQLIEDNELTIGKIKVILTRSISMEVIQGQGLGNDFSEEYERKRYVEDFVEGIIDTVVENIENEDKKEVVTDISQLDEIFNIKNNVNKEETVNNGEQNNKESENTEDTVNNEVVDEESFDIKNNDKNKENNKESENIENSVSNQEVDEEVSDNQTI